MWKTTSDRPVQMEASLDDNDDGDDDDDNDGDNDNISTNVEDYKRQTCVDGGLSG